MIKRKAEKQGPSDPPDDCSICCDPLTEESRISKIKCGHFIHTDCLIIYSKKENSKLCPLCRSTIINETVTRPVAAPITTTTTATHITTTATPIRTTTTTRTSRARPRAINHNNFSGYARKEIVNGVLDISNLPENIVNNYLANYTVEELATITEFKCYNNHLISLKQLNNNNDLRLPNLKYLYCANNSLITLNDIIAEKLTYLNCSRNILSFDNIMMVFPCLEVIVCANNALTNLDNLRIFAPNLKSLYCPNNLFENELLIYHKYLEYLNCENNKITQIKITQAPNIKYIDHTNNHLSNETASILDIHIKFNAHKV